MVSKINLGFSIYFSNSLEVNKAIIKKAKEANFKYAFTSLHIPEESNENYLSDLLETISDCAKYNISVIADVSPRSLEKLKIASFSELKFLGVTHLRIDFGFTNEEILSLSKDFNIVLNASTINEEDIKYLIEIGVNLKTVSACHNYYPKPLTGLSIKKVLRINQLLHKYNIVTMGFVAGDMTYRQPLFEGLPTIESHRNKECLYNILQLKYDCECDICMIGDVDIKDSTYHALFKLSNGYVELSVNIDESYSYLKDTIHHNRTDNSDYVFRSQESRDYGSLGSNVIPHNNKIQRKRGSICISNDLFLRYSGELEICLCELVQDDRVNIIGKVEEDYLKYLDYNKIGYKFI